MLQKLLVLAFILLECNGDEDKCLGILNFDGNAGVVCHEYRGFADYMLHSLMPTQNSSQWYGAGSISDAMVSCGDWSETNLGDRQFAIITGNRAEIKGFSEMWLKVSLPGVHASNVSAAYLFLKGGARGEGATLLMYDAPSNWTENNITCASAPADNIYHNGTSLGFYYPIQLRFILDHQYGWHKFNVTESLLSQLSHVHELNLRMAAGDQDQVPNTWYTTESHFPPQLLIELNL